MFGIFAEGDEVEDLFLLLGRAFGENFSETVGAESIEPEETTAELQLIFGIFACEEIDKFGSASFDGAAGFFVLGDNHVAQSNESGVLRGRKIFRSVVPCRSCGFLLADHLMDVGGGFRGDDLQNGTGDRTDSESAEDVATGDGVIHLQASRRKEEEFNAEGTEDAEIAEREVASDEWRVTR